MPKRVEDAFLAVFHDQAENDAFNALVMAASLEWREAAVLRAYAAYLRQIRAPFGRSASSSATQRLKWSMPAFAAQ